MNANIKFGIIILVSIALMAVYHALFALPVIIVLTRFFGLVAFFLLCISLLLGPFAVFWPNGFKPLARERRLTGLVSLAFMIAHFALLLFNRFNFDFFQITREPKYILALAAFVIFLILGITSNNFTIKKIKFPKWKIIQRLVYIAFALGLIHFYLDSNGLFIRAGEKVFLNLAEAILLLLAGVTIILQIAGFFATIKKNKKSPV